MNPPPPQPQPTCPRCSAPVPADAPAGLCPRCVLDGAATPSDSGLGSRHPNPPRLEEIAAAFPTLEILGFLGAGGMGCVYHVRERASGRVSALKILPRELATDPAFVERFEREARTLARLQHPHIVGIHGFGHSGGFCHLLMEFVDGANLRQALRAGRFTPAQALALIPHLCDALQYAHSQGVLHRDIKPENILLDAEGRVKIADFGIAKILGEPGSTADHFTLTRTGARLGTPHYMAPEQIERPEAVDHRADIYSLGVVFYELLTGELPLGRFQAPSAKAALDARVDDIVLRALAKERELRQQSASEVKAEVEHLASQPAPTTPGQPTQRTRLRVLVGGVLLAWLGTLVVIALNVGSFEPALFESLRAIPVLLVAAVAFALLHRALQHGPLRTRLVPASAGLLLVVLTLALYPRRGLPRLLRPPDASLAHATLMSLGLRLREASTTGPGGPRLPESLLDVPIHLRIDPFTGQPFIFLAAGQTNPPLGTFLVATPPRSNGHRQVLLGDGSIQNITEARFWEVVLQSNPRVGSPLNPVLLGSALNETEAAAALKHGITLAQSTQEGIRRLLVDLPAALRPIREAQFDAAAKTLHGMLSTLPEDPDREVFFALHATLTGGVPRPDFYEKTQNTHGGLLAMLAAFAARAGDAAALEYALTRGRPLWSGREDLILCERRLDGESDQDWEEIRMRTADVLALRPGSPTPMTVIRRFKAYGIPPQTNTVLMAWPRLP